MTDVVAIDGPSGAGKSTVARKLARSLGFSYLDTGAMYRAVTVHLLAAGCAPAPGEAAADPRRDALLAALELDVTGDGRVRVNGVDVTDSLRSKEVESAVSAVSAMPAVRSRMRDLQRRIAASGPIVAEGRDMGSVVFPNARWKIYLDAGTEERARRRQLDFAAGGREVSRADVQREIEARDRLDSTREHAPLVRAPDAHHLDSSTLSIDEVVEAIAGIVRASGGPSGGEGA